MRIITDLSVVLVFSLSVVSLLSLPCSTVAFDSSSPLKDHATPSDLGDY